MVQATPIDLEKNFLDEEGLNYFWGKIDNAKQDTLTAGSNVSINNNTISATNTKYSLFYDDTNHRLVHNEVNGGILTPSYVGLPIPTRTVLYTGTTFSNTITLSETKENFDEIEVFFENNNVQQSTKFQVKSGSQKTLLMYGWWDTTSSVHYQPQGLTFDGTSVTYGHNARARFTSGDSQMSYTGNNITITKIVGYKY